MSDDVIRTRNALARLHSTGYPPDPDALAAAQAAHATSMLDREIRNRTEGVVLDGAQLAHLCGLLVGSVGVKYDAVTEIEQAIRLAVRSAAEAR